MYKIIRCFMLHPSEVIKRGLTLEQAQEHCRNPETSSSKCTDPEMVELTRTKGPWFDGYDPE